MLLSCKVDIVFKQLLLIYCYPYRSEHFSALIQKCSSLQSMTINRDPQLVNMQIIKDYGMLCSNGTYVSHLNPQGSGSFREEEAEDYESQR